MRQSQTPVMSLSGLLADVLEKKDLSKAGDLFLVEDNVVVKNLLVIVENIHKIIGQAGYVSNDNDQSIVEITVTRITSAIRETGLVVEHAAALVTLLESCLRHDLKPTARGEDPPHAKIASDIISCLFLNYSQKEVMRLALPVAVKFLHKGNKELSRNMSSYLSLAAMENADLLSNCVQLIIDSVISGNYALSRVLPQIYAVDWERIHDHVMALVSLLPLCDTHEKLALLSLFQLIAEKKPNLLEPSLSQLWECLSFPSCLHPTLGIFIHMANARPQPFVDYVTRLEAVALKDRSTLPSVIKIIGPVGRMNKDRAGEAIPYLLSQLPQMEAGKLSIPLKELVSICDAHPSLLTEKILKEVGSYASVCPTGSNAWTCIQHLQNEFNTIRSTTVNQTSGGVTIVQLSGNADNSGLSKWKLGDGSRSTSRLSNDRPKLSVLHHSTSKLVTSGPSTGTGAGGYMYKSLSVLGGRSLGIGILKTASSSNKSMSGSMNMSVFRNEDVAPASLPNPVSPGAQVSPPPIQSQQGHPVSLSLCLSGGTSPLSMASNHRLPSVSGNQGVTPIYPWPQPSSPPMTRPSTTGEVTILKTHQSGSSNPPSQMAGVTYRKGSTSVTISSKMPSTPTSTGAQRISVFEPYPMRDAVYHFCEKHLEKIKIYMETVFVTLPLPVRCTIEERKNRKHAKLYFACQGKGEHCLYNRTFFTMKTRQPRIWIHLMFLALQARSSTALSTRESSVSSLKNCWDTLKCENKAFVTLVTSAFPSGREQELLIHELRGIRYFDVFEYNAMAGQWGCFLCNHPDRATGFLQPDQPVIEGQLKEKKGKWRLFKRWRMRYFTLSAGHLSYRGVGSSKSDKELVPIELNQIRSVKTISRGGRHLPKAFEIFTDDCSFVLKPQDGKNAEEWVQCLSIALAHTHAKGNHSRTLSAFGSGSLR